MSPSATHFNYLILVEPLGLLYGASGRLLSPAALTGRASEHFPPDSPALAGLLTSVLQPGELRPSGLHNELFTAGPFWLDPDQGLMLPAPFTLLQEQEDGGPRFSKRRLVWTKGKGEFIPDGWQPADQEEPPRKAPSGGWIPLSDWPKVGHEEELTIHENPWLAVSHLHPRLKDDERVSKGKNALFLEYGIALQDEVCLAYISSHSVADGVYRFGGEGHLVELRSQEIPKSLQDLLEQPLTPPFTLITPGLWGGPRLSRREPIITRQGGGVLPWHRNGNPPGILTEKARPWRHRLGAGTGRSEPDGGKKRRRLSRGRWAVPAGSCYQVAGDPLVPWSQWDEDWFPKEGFSFKHLGTGLALPLHSQP